MDKRDTLTYLRDMTQDIASVILVIIAKGFCQCKGSLIIHRVFSKFNWADPPLILRMAKDDG
jgi:hypothetical protein